SHNDELLCDPEVYQDHEKVQAIHADNEKLNQELETLLSEWEELSTEES
ncbi:ABC transporter C-terminal domain-containing protein, partial [Bacillus inaquosorum]